MQGWIITHQRILWVYMPLSQVTDILVKTLDLTYVDSLEFIDRSLLHPYRAAVVARWRCCQSLIYYLLGQRIDGKVFGRYSKHIIVSKLGLTFTCGVFVLGSHFMVWKGFPHYWAFVREISWLLHFWRGNPTITSRFPNKEPITRRFHILVVASLNKLWTNSRDVGGLRHYLYVTLLWCFMWFPVRIGTL